MITLSKTHIDEKNPRFKNLDRGQMIVLKAIKKYGPITSQNLSSKLNWPINCVSGRVTELRKMSMVENQGRIRYYGTGRTRKLWAYLEL